MVRPNRKCEPIRDVYMGKLSVLLAVGIVVLGLSLWQGQFKTLSTSTSSGPLVYREAGWVPPHLSDRWKCLVIHHSGTKVGSATRFDQYHRARGMDELAYHFVIGNGTDTGDGEVEVGKRWTVQKHGAHCKTPDEYYNEHGIGICLVGNFEKNKPTPAQLESLTRLVYFLCKQFNISPARVYTHGQITGLTLCPGNKFNLDGLREEISKMP